MSDRRTDIAMRAVGRCVGLLLLASSSLDAQASRPADGAVPASHASSPKGWWGDVFADRTATLSEVLTSPEAFRDRVVRLQLQFARSLKPANVFHTKFDPEHWLNFGAWGDEALLWDAAAYRAEHAYFFMSRELGEAKAVADAAPYTRFAVRARVVEVLRGAPWIEVLSATALPGRMTEASLLRLVKAAKLREHRRFDAAAEELGAADEGGLPTGTRIVMLRDRAECLSVAGRRREAAEVLKAASALRPEDANLAAEYASARAKARLKDAPAESQERPAASTTSTSLGESTATPASRPTSKDG